MRRFVLAFIVVVSVVGGGVGWFAFGGTAGNPEAAPATTPTTALYGNASDNASDDAGSGVDRAWYDRVAPSAYDDDASALRDVEQCASEDLCIADVLRAYAVAVGPERAIAIARSTVDNASGSVNCHRLYESIARAVTVTNGLLSYTNVECQFGYVHGVLYALAKVYDSFDTLLPDVMKYCAAYQVDTESINSPDQACYHGVGHAAAGLTYDDPEVAVQACIDAAAFYVGPSTNGGPDAVESCVDGVFMEYGDGNLVRAGLLSSTSSGISTSLDPKKVAATCDTIQRSLAFKCYSRIWKFVAPGSDDLAKTATICDRAPNAESRTRCYNGFGEMVVSSILWESRLFPPDTPAQARDLAIDVVRECARMGDPMACVGGAMSSTNSHLWAVSYDEDLVPDYCAYVDAADSAVCERYELDARGLNWDMANSGTTAGTNRNG
jgi:hypothetical protein